MTQITIPFSKDRSTQIYLQREGNRKRAESNCNRLINYWLSRNDHISKYDALKMGIDCLSQRVANIRKSGIPVLSETRNDLGESFKRYFLEPAWREANK